MTFERPDAWWLLALAAPIVALHLHHRKRRVVEVSSVELWRGLIAGGVGRGRFRALRDALALAFLIAALVAFTVSAAGPVTGAEASGPRRLAIVIDASPSMNARQQFEATRFTDAVELAVKAADHLAPQDEVCVWLAAESPRVVVEPTRRDALGVDFLRARVRPSLAPTCLAATTRLAVRASRGTSDKAATVLVLTDAMGGNSLSDVDFGDGHPQIGDVTWIGGTHPKNAGVVACDVDPADSGRVIVRAAITDGPSAVSEGRLTVWRGGDEIARSDIQFDESGVASATLPLGAAAKTGGLFHVGIPGDDFAEDDFAWLMLPAAKPFAVAVVSDKPSPFLVEALRAMPDVADPARTTLVAPGAPASAFDDADVVIAEGVAAPTAGKPTLTFVGAGPRVTEKPLLWGVGSHAILAGVDLSPLRIERAVVLDPATGETSIIASAAGAVGVAGETDGVRRVTFGFRPDATTLPLEAAFPLLVRNSLRWLAKPPAAPRYVVAGEPWPDGDGALVPYPTPGGPHTAKSPTGMTTVVRWIPPKGFHLSPATPSTAPSAADVVASLPDRHGDADTRRRHAPWLAAVGAALLALGALLLPKARPAERPTVVAPPEDVLVASR